MIHVSQYSTAQLHWSRWNSCRTQLITWRPNSSCICTCRSTENHAKGRVHYPAVWESSPWVQSVYRHYKLRQNRNLRKQSTHQAIKKHSLRHLNVNSSVKQNSRCHARTGKNRGLRRDGVSVSHTFECRGENSTKTFREMFTFALCRLCVLRGNLP